MSTLNSALAPRATNTTDDFLGANTTLGPRTSKYAFTRPWAGGADGDADDEGLSDGLTETEIDDDGEAEGERLGDGELLGDTLNDCDDEGDGLLLSLADGESEADGD